MSDNVVTALVAIISSVGTYFATKMQSQYQMRSKKFESDSATESIYVQNMETILKEYKEQVSGFRAEVAELRDENKRIKEEFKQFKEQQYEEIKEYKEFVIILENELEEVKQERDEWKEKYEDLKRG